MRKGDDEPEPAARVSHTDAFNDAPCSPNTRHGASIKPPSGAHQGDAPAPAAPMIVNLTQTTGAAAERFFVGRERELAMLDRYCTDMQPPQHSVAGSDNQPVCHAVIS
eukprot:COSAG01_NODE_22461_length_854_cov_82.090066_1_plen_107_part_01